MPSNNQPGGFLSYGDLYNLNKDELQRMQREAEERWQSANTADEAAKRGYGQAKGEAERFARASGHANEGKFFGGYSDYVRQRDSASAQWKAYKEKMRQSQMASRSLFEAAAGGTQMRAAGDDEDWTGMDAAFTADVNKAAGQYRRPTQQAPGYNPQPAQAVDIPGLSRKATAQQTKVQALRQRVNSLNPGPARTTAQRELEQAEAELRSLWQQVESETIRQQTGRPPTPTNNQPAGVTGTGSYTPPQNQQQTSGTGSYKPPGT